MLVCFVSIQIAQAENDGLLAIKDGFQDLFWRWQMESVPMEWDDYKSRNASILCWTFKDWVSFERTKQEDILLYVLNAAISNLTIFNKGF